MGMWVTRRQASGHAGEDLIEVLEGCRCAKDG